MLLLKSYVTGRFPAIHLFYLRPLLFLVFWKGFRTSKRQVQSFTSHTPSFRPCFSRPSASCRTQSSLNFFLPASGASSVAPLSLPPKGRRWWFECRSAHVDRVPGSPFRMILLHEFYLCVSRDLRQLNLFAHAHCNDCADRATGYESILKYCWYISLQRCIEDEFEYVVSL